MNDCSVTKDNGEHTKTRLELCEELWIVGRNILDKGYNPVFVSNARKKPKPVVVIENRSSKRLKDFALCKDVVDYGHKLLDAGYNPKITCEFKPVQEYVETTGSFPSKGTYLHMRAKYGW